MIVLQTRSFRMTGLVFATAPLGLVGAVPALLLTGTSFGFNAILGLIGLGGILMRNTLILVDQIEAERARGSQTRPQGRIGARLPLPRRTSTHRADLEPRGVSQTPLARFPETVPVVIRMGR